ncbi:MAG: DNA/RNA non-specific endonuclease, partial [Blastocatellia bacterium]|nr:DNA/RNA non-specific endonuclease [Blastocatellia bacterium]
NAMARTIPVIISFLARLLGLGGISEKIRSFIEGIRERVDKAIDKLIEKVMAGIKKAVGVGKAAVASVVEWWKKEKKVKVGEKTALIYFEGTEETARLTIKASPSQNYTDYLAGIASKMSSPDQKKAHAEATAVGKRIESKISSHNLTKGETDALVVDLNRFGELLEIMLGAAAPPPSIINYGAVTAEQGGTRAEAKVLSQDSGGSKGSEPADDPPIWQAVQHRKSDDNKRAYVQGHLLNHNVHGPGKRFNMAPITYTANAEHKNGIEEEIKKRVLVQNEVAYYKITAVYGTHPTSPDYTKLTSKAASTLTPDEQIQLRAMEADRKLPLRFEFDAHTLKNDNGKWIEDKKISYAPVENEIPKKAPGPGGTVHVERLERLSINNPVGGSHTAEEALLHLENIGGVRAAALLAELTKRKFTSWTEVVARKIPGVTDDLIEKWQDQTVPGTSQRLVYFHGETIWK